jgi:hypothetical protein
MDFASTMKSEVFRPIAILIVPGALASFPYFMLATKYFPDLAQYRDGHEVPYYAVSLLLVIAVGLLLEDMGSVIEAEFWDKLLEKEYKLEETWDKYLALSFDKEPIGHRYLRTMVLRLKFELGFSIAVLPFLIGLAWLNAAFPVLSWPAYGHLALGFVVVAIYLLWESFRGARVLAETRRTLVAQFGH